MRVLDLFAGDGGASAAFRLRGHDVTTLDLGVDGDFDVDFKKDIMDVTMLDFLERGHGAFDFIWASPPCTAFSVAAMGKNWKKHPHRNEIIGPKHERARVGMKIADHTFALIDSYRRAHPKVRYVVENPVGALRVMPFTVKRTDRVTTWYCRWGDFRPGAFKPRAKPTDLWTNLRGDFPMCSARNPDHESAPRGARTGTQGITGKRFRSLVPYRLSLAVCLALESDGIVRPELAGGIPSEKVRLF